MASSYIATRQKRDIVSPYPVSLHIEPALVCNYRCAVCWHDRRDDAPKASKFMDLDAYKHLLDQVKGKTWSLELTGNGESTLHPRFYEMVSYAVDNGFYTKFETNGSRVDIDSIEASGAQTIHFALDGMSTDTYKSYRVGGKFPEVKENLEKLVDLKNRTGWPHIEVRFLVFRHNQHEMAEAEKYLDSLGVSWRFQWARVPNEGVHENILQRWSMEVRPDDFKKWSPTIPEYVAYRKDTSTGMYRHFSTFGDLKPKCTAVWTMLYIRTDGEVVPCCEMLNESELSLGNVFNEGFDAVWNGPRIRAFRRALADDPKDLHPCNVCPANMSCHSLEVREDNSVTAPLETPQTSLPTVDELRLRGT